MKVHWRDAFFEEDFNVDKCLANYTHKHDLESLRNELKQYAIELHQEMSEILKTETETIINLAEYLTSLSLKIESLNSPVLQLQEEIKTVFVLLQKATHEFGEVLTHAKINIMEKDDLSLLKEVITLCAFVNNIIDRRIIKDIHILERLVMKFSVQSYYVSQLKIIPSDVESSVFQVEKKLLDILNEQFINSFLETNIKGLSSCLFMYDILSRQTEAEKVFQENVVRNGLKGILCEENFRNHEQDIDKIYDEILNFMEENTSAIFKILEGKPELRGFNFILNSFWPEIDRQCRKGLPYLTAPGNPDLFQKRFKSTWNFCSKIAVKCGDENLIKSNPSFRNHIKRFNLPVYFEIRFQQIASNYEKYMLIKPSKSVYNSDNSTCMLKITSALLDSIKDCFRQDVFLGHLADQFLKLSMLLLSRYFKWFEVSLLKETNTANKEIVETLLIVSLKDFKIVQDAVAFESTDTETINKSFYSVIPNNLKPMVPIILKECAAMIEHKSNEVIEKLVDFKIRDVLHCLQNVTIIPRLYRKTNRDIPKEPSNYVKEAVKTVILFNNKLSSLTDIGNETVFNEILTKITKEYLVLVQGMLNSVCKTEESLRRLKSRTMGNTEENSSSSLDIVSDETKIREQIKLDITYFIQQLYPMGKERNKKVLNELKEVLNRYQL